jgi:hypothetical protein
MSFGIGHAALVGTGGALTMIGDNMYGQSTVPANLGPVSAAHCGMNFTAALTTAGQVVCFGDNGVGQCSVPPTLGPVVEIAAGRTHVVARRPNGTVAGWGSPGASSIPSTLGAVQSLAAGGYSSAAIRVDGSVRTWGFASGLTIAPPAIGSWSKVAIGLVGSPSTLNHPHLVLRSDGMEIRLSTPPPNGSTVPNEAYPAIDIAAARSGFLVLRADGQLFRVVSNGTPGQAAAPGPTYGVTAVFGGEMQFGLLRRDVADLDGNGTVGSADLALLLSAWGTSGSAADLDGSGTVDSPDLALLLSVWSQT